jgi:hypothetical protein
MLNYWILVTLLSYSSIIVIGNRLAYIISIGHEGTFAFKICRNSIIG